MRKVIIVTALLAVLGVPDTARGAFIDGNTLHTRCNSPEDVYDKASCLWFVIGVADAIGGPNKGYQGRTFCHPSSVLTGQLRDVVKKWLNENPQLRHFTAVSLTAKALSEAFPCKTVR